MNKIQKTVYIIIPVYNVEKYLSKCLDSVFNQTYKNIEVICVNDGSTDSSPQILRNYSKQRKDSIVIIDKLNGGLASARNAGLKSIDCLDNSYIAFIDSDDWVESNYIAKLVEMLEANSVDIVCSTFFFATDNSFRKYQNNIEKDKKLDSLEATRLLILDETIQSHVPTKLYKSELFKKLFFNEDISYMEDQAFTFKVMYKAKTTFVTNYAGYFYRQGNENSLTKKKIDNSKVVSGLKAYYSVCRYFKDTNDSELLMPPSHNALIAAYLMLIPYYKKKTATGEEKKDIKEIKKYIKDNRLVAKYVPNNRNNKIKKTLYLICPPLYPKLFKIAKKLG